jgi:hypothetical protein
MSSISADGESATKVHPSCAQKSQTNLMNIYDYSCKLLQACQATGSKRYRHRPDGPRSPWTVPETQQWAEIERRVEAVRSAGRQEVQEILQAASSNGRRDVFDRKNMELEGQPLHAAKGLVLEIWIANCSADVVKKGDSDQSGSEDELPSNRACAADLEKCVAAISEWPAVALSVLRGQKMEEFASDPESAAWMVVNESL